MHKRFGFTVVEVAVIIVVIVIIATMSAFGFNAVQEQGRDSARAVSAEQIANALEKYYEENGEYPGCSVMAGSLSEIKSSLKGIDSSALISPTAPNDTENSIVCRDESAADIDTFSYSGDNSADCSTGTACRSWRLSYVEESTGETKIIQSRRVVSGATSTISIDVLSSSMSSVELSWNIPPDAASYQLERSLSNSMSSPTVTTHSTPSATVGGLAPSTSYYFRVRAIFPGGTTGAWSPVADASTADTGAPTGTVVVSASISGANLVISTSGGTCASGSTIEYQNRDGTSSGAWGSWNDGGSRSPAATEGKTYVVQSRARCIRLGVGSSWVSSATKTATRSVTSPYGLTMTSAMSGTNAVGTAGGGSCATGTTLQRQVRSYSTSTATAGAWSGWTSAATKTVAASEGYRYVFSQQARCTGSDTSSSWVASSESGVTRAITTVPASPTISMNATSTGISYTRTSSPACPAGTTTYYTYKYIGDWNYDSGWYGPSSSVSSLEWSAVSQGYQYKLQMRAQCSSSHATGPVSAVREVSYIRPIDLPSGPATGFKHTVASDRKSRYFEWTAPTCGPGTRAESRSNSYLGSQVPNTGGGLVWTETGANGWLHGASGWSQRDYYTSRWTSTYNGSSTLPVNIEVKYRNQYICINSATGRTGSWGPTAESAMFKT